MSVRDELVNLILKVAMGHHQDIRKQDDDAACDCADKILAKYPGIGLVKLEEKEVMNEMVCVYGKKEHSHKELDANLIQDQAKAICRTFGAERKEENEI